MRATPPAGPQVVLENGAKPGQLSVTNRGPGSVDLLRKVTVEIRQDGKWGATPAEVALVASCGEKSTAPVHLNTGQTLQVAPWDGWGCNGQCPRSCRANYYLGPGEFRFVVWTADQKTRFEGQPFRLSDKDPRK